jgi:hypothetical protein
VSQNSGTLSFKLTKITNFKVKEEIMWTAKWWDLKEMVSDDLRNSELCLYIYIYIYIYIYSLGGVEQCPLLLRPLKA